MKYLTIIFLSVSFLNASYLYTNICIEDYYFNNQTYFYQKSTDLSWNSISLKTETIPATILKGYSFDSVTQKCIPSTSLILGMESTQFYFLLALSGLLFSSIIFCIIATFLMGL